MTQKDFNRLTSGKIKNDELVEIFRSNIDELSSIVNIVDVSSQLICYQNILDFLVDGYKTVRLKDVTDVITCEKNSNLNFINSIFKNEKIFSNQRQAYNIKSWQDFFAQLKSQNIAVTVECAFEDAIEYYFGWIKSIDKNIATMQCFDGSGILFKDEVKVNLDFVSAVTVGDRYTSLMSKYVK